MGLYKCKWNIGDVFAYKLTSDLSKERDLFGRYFLIQKVDERIWHPGHIVPIVYVKLTSDQNLPTTKEEYEQLEYVQTWNTRYENRFFPIDGRNLEKDILEKSKIKYEVDEFGFLPQYRITLLNTSKRAIPSSLVFIGNFTETIKPAKEFIPHSVHNISSVAWKQFGQTFETVMLERYCGYNLRELGIYSKA